MSSPNPNPIKNKQKQINGAKGNGDNVEMDKN